MPALQSQRWNAESFVLIRAIRIQCAERRFGNAPWNILAPRILHLLANGILTGRIQKRFLMAARIKRGHEIFKHRSAPRKEYRAAVFAFAVAPAQIPPV